jgi:hypothetical protein
MHLKDTNAALDMLAPAMEQITRGFLNIAKHDPDIDSVREHPRFNAMVAAAEARLDAEEAATKPARP